MTKKICISGYYGFDNFGDETILKILVENIKKFDCKTQITVFSSNPDKTAKNLDVRSIFSFDILSVLKSLLNSDYLISGGGSLLQDVTSLKSLVYYLGVITFAQLFGKKTIIFAQGIGPINNKFFQKLTAFVLKHSKCVLVRDSKSVELLKSWGVSSLLCNDPVWNLSVRQKNKLGKIGVQLRSFPKLTDKFIIKLAENINKYYSDKEICVLSLQNKLDLEPCNKLKDELLKLNSKINVKIIENTSNDKVVEDISELEVLIAMRFHACLVGIKSGIKVIPINYDIKVETLAEELNLTDISLKDIDDIDKAITSDNICNSDKISERLFDFKILERIIKEG